MHGPASVATSSRRFDIDGLPRADRSIVSPSPAVFASLWTIALDRDAHTATLESEAILAELRAALTCNRDDLAVPSTQREPRPGPLLLDEDTIFIAVEPLPRLLRLSGQAGFNDLSRLRHRILMIGP